MTTTTKSEVTRYRENWQAEVDGAALYRALAEAEDNPQLAEVYRRLATSEEEHAHIWERKLRAAGVVLPPPRPGWRTRTLSWLAKRLGPQIVLPTIIGMERIDSHRYDHQDDAREAGLPTTEQSHAFILGTIARTVRTGLEGGAIARLEGRHRAIGGNALRAAVLGANDGLVSNLRLVMGVAGANLPGHAILIAGMAGLLAGACSMAMGEWLSVTSSRELYQRQIDIEAAELEEEPQAEREELVLIYQAKGMPEEQARRLADQLMQDRESALDTLVREELGIDPKELGGSAWEAAVASFVLFAIGAIVPVIPFTFMAGAAAVVTSLLASVLALFGIGAGITLLTGRSVWSSGLRQVLIGMGAAAITFGVGRLIGVAIS
jgi:VIT1/CCC1 family predicted Fe2+/Mn2+ transporter